MRPLFVLIHSPLVGPATWGLVAQELRRRGEEAVVPSLHDARCSSGPYWQRHVNFVSSALRSVVIDRRVVLVAHSGAGPLLPAIGAPIGREVAAYLFVDAGLPGEDGQSRLDLFQPGEAKQFRDGATQGVIPAPWRNDELLSQQGIDDAELRRRFAAEVLDVPLGVYEEPLPVPSGWPDAPCGYLLFSVPYEADAERARSLGWPFRELRGSHFHMLVDPVAVTDALLGLAGEMAV